MNKHICFVSLDYPTPSGGGGVGTVTKILAQALIDEGIRVSVIKLDIQQHSYVDEGVEVHGIIQGSLHYYISKIPLLGALLALSVRELERSVAVRRKIREINNTAKIDLLEFTEEGGFLSFFPSRVIKSICVTRLHGAEYSWAGTIPGNRISFRLKLQRVFQRYSFRKSDVLIAPSAYYKKQLDKELKGTSYPKIKVIWNPLKQDEEINIKGNKVARSSDTILYCGRIQDCKGVDVLLRACSIARAAFPNLKLNIAGIFHPSFPEKTFNSIVVELNLKNNIVYLGHIQRQKLLEEMRTAAVVVVPSYSESFSMVGVEAILQGAPLIHTRVGFFADSEGELPNVTLINTKDEEALANAIVQHLSKEVVIHPDSSEVSKKYVLDGLAVYPHTAFYKSLFNAQS